MVMILETAQAKGMVMVKARLPATVMLSLEMELQVRQLPEILSRQRLAGD
jgi:hypothetical protein